MFIYFWDSERQNVSRGGAEREGDRIQSSLQALSCQRRAQCGARTHEPRDHDLSRSRMLNRWSHPGALLWIFQEWFQKSNVVCLSYDLINFSSIARHVDLDFTESSFSMRFPQNGVGRLTSGRLGLPAPGKHLCPPNLLALASLLHFDTWPHTLSVPRIIDQIIDLVLHQVRRKTVIKKDR